MTDKELIQAVRCCTSTDGVSDCPNCPRKDVDCNYRQCIMELVSSIADRMNALLAENERLWDSARRLWAGMPRYCGDLPRFAMHEDEPPCTEEGTQCSNVPTKWISVEERLPATKLETAAADEPDDAISCEMSACVLVVDRTGEVRVARYELGPYFRGWQENGRAVEGVTHWMPLPSTEGVE